jgi:hypothetical protein
MVWVLTSAQVDQAILISISTVLGVVGVLRLRRQVAPAPASPIFLIPILERSGIALFIE